MKTYDTEALKLVENILEEQIQTLTQDDLTLLLEHKESCLNKVLPILMQEITLLENNEEWNSTRLHWSLKLAAFFEETKAFPWICRLHRHVDAISQELGPLFINLYWASLLASIAGPHISKLKEEIEDPSIDEDMRRACLEAIPLLVGDNKLDRSAAVEYFQSLYKKIFSGEIEDTSFVLDLVDASILLWPGEFLEDIKELFGLDFIHDSQIELSCIIETYNNGLEEALSEIKDWRSSCHPLEPLVPNRMFEEEAMEHLAQEMLNSDEHISYLWEPHSLEMSEEVAQMGGLVVFTSEDSSSNSTITEGYIEDPMIESLPSKDKKKYLSLCPLSEQRPEKALEVTLELLEKYPQIPSLHHYLYANYRALDMRKESIEALRQLIEKFPNYLSDAFTLPALLPEREAFYVAEWVKFAHVIGWYFLQIGIIEQAEYHLDILRQVAPTSEEFYDLESRIQNSLFQSSLDDDLLKFD